MGLTKLEQLEEGHARRERELAEAEVKLVELAEREREAVAFAVRDAPMARTYGVGGRPERIRSDLRAHEKRVENLRTELQAVAVALGEARREKADVDLAEFARRARELNRRELNSYKAAGVVVEAFLEAWAKLVPALEERDRLRETVERSGTLGEAAAETVAAWEEAREPRILPVPVDPLALFRMLYEVSADPHGDGYRDAGQGRVDDHRRLPGLVADFRGRVRRVELSGNTPTNSSSPRRFVDWAAVAGYGEKGGVR